MRPHSALADRSPEEFARDWKRIERGLAAHGSAGKPNAGRRGALQRYRGSETLAAFRPTLIREGRAPKSCPWTARNRQRERASCQRLSIESVECDKCRKHRHQPTTPRRNLYRRSVYFRGAGQSRQTLTHCWHTCRGKDQTHLWTATQSRSNRLSSNAKKLARRQSAATAR
jgi:hypothetical protein